MGGDKTITPSPVSPPPINTEHPPAQFSPDQATPRAQTRQEVETFAERTRLRSSSANSLDSTFTYSASSLFFANSRQISPRPTKLPKTTTRMTVSQLPTQTQTTKSTPSKPPSTNAGRCATPSPTSPPPTANAPSLTPHPAPRTKKHGNPAGVSASSCTSTKTTTTSASTADLRWICVESFARVCLMLGRGMMRWRIVC